MAKDIPYMQSVKNLPAILNRIKEAQTPPKFTHEFLKSNLGFSSSNDRAVIKVFKSLGFLASDSRPTERYNEFRSEETSGYAMSQGLSEGWSDIFLSDSQAHKRTSTQLREIFKNVTGKSESVATKMATTFSTLVKFANFAIDQPEPAISIEEEVIEESPIAEKPRYPVQGLSLRNDIHIHLPATSDVAVYTAIFRAIREELVD
jgi:hypothetical protein